MAVVTVTLNPCIDKTFLVERVAPDRQLDARDVRLFPGGGGLNVARAVRELGGEVRALWTCGGHTGGRLAELLDEDGVPHEPVRIEDTIRENLMVTETPSREQYRFGMPGPELREEERAEWGRRLRELSPPPDLAVFSGSLPAGASPGWFGELLRSFPDGTRVVVDTKKEALARALEERVFLVKPNLRELEDVVGRELPGDDEIEEAAGEIVASGGPEVVLVSLGRGGAVLVTAEGAERLPAPTVRLKSRIGAGDSMVGGLVRALDAGRPLRDAAAFGVAAGAAAVMQEGTALCRRGDTDRLYRRTRRRPAER